MPELIATLMLAFANIPFMFLISLIGIWFKGRSFLFQTALLITFNIIINVALKGSFKIPLSPQLGIIGYAFPSGHMQSATVFYIWFILQIPFKLCGLLVGLLLTATAATLIHYGYHDIKDVMGGFVVGLLVVGTFQYAVSKHIKHLSWILLLIASICMVYSEFMYQSIPHAYAWVAYSILILLIFSERMASKNWFINQYH